RHPEEHGCGVSHDLETLLRFSQLFFGDPSLCGVANDGNAPDDGSAFVAKRRVVDVVLSVGHALADEEALTFDGCSFACQRFLEARGFAVLSDGEKDLTDLLSERLGSGSGKERLHD